IRLALEVFAICWLIWVIAYNRIISATKGPIILIEIRNSIISIPVTLQVANNDADAEEAQLRELAEQLAREAMRPVPLRGVRLDFGPGELPRQRLDLPLVRRKLEGHRAASIRRSLATPTKR